MAYSHGGPGQEQPWPPQPGQQPWPNQAPGQSWPDQQQSWPDQMPAQQPSWPGPQPGPQPAQPPWPGQQQWTTPAQGGPRTAGAAVASLVLGLVAVFSVCGGAALGAVGLGVALVLLPSAVLGLALGIAAVVTGFIGRRQTRAGAGGNGLAITGLVLGFVVIGLILALVILVVVAIILES